MSENFYIVAREAGQVKTDLPTWANDQESVIEFSGVESICVKKFEVDTVPGAFQLLGVLTDKECDQLVSISDKLGFDQDAPVSLGRNIRHNLNFNWIVNRSINQSIWDRCREFFPPGVSATRALGLNSRFRFYRYQQGDFFKPHTDGAWPGTEVIGSNLVQDAYGDRLSQMTLLLFLSDGYEGGRTLFYTHSNAGVNPGPNHDPGPVAIATPRGAALCFPHGFHPDHCVHAGEVVASGVKDIIRTDVLYELPPR